MLKQLEKTFVFLQCGCQYTLRGEKEDSFTRFTIIPGTGTDKLLVDVSRDVTNLILTQHLGRPGHLTTLSQ